MGDSPGDDPRGGASGDSTGDASTSGAHLTGEFRDRFPTWSQLQSFFATSASGPELDPSRAMQQLVMADLLAMLNRAAPRWHLLGSLALPVRPHPDDPWPDELRPSQTGVAPPYCAARPAFDLDLFASALRDCGPSEYAARVVAAVHDIAPPSTSPSSLSAGAAAEPGSGLGGLVRYSANALTEHETGQVMGTLTVQPVDDRYGPGRTIPVDDPLIVEIDIKPPAKMTYVGSADRSYRSVVGLEVPGLQPILPRLFPIANQIADKLVLLTGPPTSLRGQNTAAWHRYKDLVDLYFLISTCRVDAALLHRAITTNWNWRRMDHDLLPDPYRVYGQVPLQRPDERPVPWEIEIERLRSEQPSLRRYPRFDAIVDTIARFTGGLVALGHELRGQRWTPGVGWHVAPAHAVGQMQGFTAAQRLYRAPAPGPAVEPPRPVSPPPATRPATPERWRGESGPRR